MLTVCCFKWRPFEGYRSEYAPETVHVLKSMVSRHYTDPFRFVCITDDPTGLNGIETVPLWNDYADIPHPSSPGKHPSCYRRLKVFAPEMRAILGKRFVVMDLDCVILGDLRPLWNRPEDFIGLAGTQPPTTFNGSMFLMNAGARPRVWQDFNPTFSPINAQKAGHYGSDQAWISYILGPREARWTTADGVFSYRLHVAPAKGRVPKGAKLVFFNGKKDPWSPEIRGMDWIEQHYH